MDSIDEEELTLSQRVLLATIAFLQNALVGGIIYGWASLQGLLCADPSRGGAGLTLEQSTTIFAWASSTAMLAGLVLGVVLDRYGPRICSLTAHLCIGVGCQFFAMATDFRTYAFATCLISFGGPGIQVSIVHVANLFPRNQYLVLSGLNGSISVSFALFAIFDWIWFNVPGTSLKFLFTCYVPIVILSLLAAAYCWPDRPFAAPEKEINGAWEPSLEEDFVEATTSHQHLLEQPLDSYLRDNQRDRRVLRARSFLISAKAMERGAASLVSLKDQPFYSQLKSATYLRSLLFLLVTCFMANFYIASFSIELADSGDFTALEQQQYARLLTLIISAGVVASFVVGFLMDIFGQEVCTVLTLMLAQIHLLLLIERGDQRPWLILSFVVYGFFRQFLFPVFIATLTARLGFKYYGLLSGIAFALSGLVQPLMASLVRSVQGTCHKKLSDDCSHGHWKTLHVMEIGLLFLLMLSPFFEHIERTRYEEQVRVVFGSSQSLKNYGALSVGDEDE